MVDLSNKIKVNATGPLPSSENPSGGGQVDKRPRKENETDMYSESYKPDEDMRMYGYTTPEKVRTGHLTLRQFDELLKEYKESGGSADVIQAAVKRLKLKTEDVYVLLDYYKTFTVISKDTTKTGNDSEIFSIFPNTGSKSNQKQA
jgi:hypothetical protein